MVFYLLHSLVIIPGGKTEGSLIFQDLSIDHTQAATVYAGFGYDLKAHGMQIVGVCEPVLKLQTQTGLDVAGQPVGDIRE